MSIGTKDLKKYNISNFAYMSKLINVIALLLLFNIAGAQIDQKILEKGASSPATESEFIKQYKKDIKKSKINGVYIPKDLDDAFKELIALSPKESIESYKLAEEDVVAKKLHFGLGKWMIANWRFETGSRLSAFLKDKGLTDPNHMAQFILRSFHRHLNGAALNEEILIAHYKEEVVKEKLIREQDRKVLKEEKRVIPKKPE